MMGEQRGLRLRVSKGNGPSYYLHTKGTLSEQKRLGEMLTGEGFRWSIEDSKGNTVYVTEGDKTDD